MRGSGPRASALSRNSSPFGLDRPSRTSPSRSVQRNWSAASRWRSQAAGPSRRPAAHGRPALRSVEAAPPKVVGRLRRRLGGEAHILRCPPSRRHPRCRSPAADATPGRRGQLGRGGRRQAGSVEAPRGPETGGQPPPRPTQGEGIEQRARVRAGRDVAQPHGLELDRDLRFVEQARDPGTAHRGVGHGPAVEIAPVADGDEAKPSLSETRATAGGRPPRGPGRSGSCRGCCRPSSPPS